MIDACAFMQQIVTTQVNVKVIQIAPDTADHKVILVDRVKSESFLLSKQMWRSFMSTMICQETVVVYIRLETLEMQSFLDLIVHKKKLRHNQTNEKEIKILLFEQNDIISFRLWFSVVVLRTVQMFCHMGLLASHGICVQRVTVVVH